MKNQRNSEEQANPNDELKENREQRKKITWVFVGL